MEIMVDDLCQIWTFLFSMKMHKKLEYCLATVFVWIDFDY